MMRQFFRTCGMLVLCLALAGCLGLGAQTPATRYYHLSAEPSERIESAQSFQMVIAVGPVQLPAYLDRPHIVTRRGDTEVELAEFSRWAEPLKESLPRVLARNLTNQLPAATIDLYPFTSGRKAALVLDFEVFQFDGRFGKTVVLDVAWRVGAVNRRSRYEEGVRGNSVEELVKSMNRTLALWSEEVAAVLLALSSSDES